MDKLIRLVDFFDEWSYIGFELDRYRIIDVQLYQGLTNYTVLCLDFNTTNGLKITIKHMGTYYTVLAILNGRTYFFPKGFRLSVRHKIGEEKAMWRSIGRLVGRAMR